jgi:hypothetical protein
MADRKIGMMTLYCGIPRVAPSPRRNYLFNAALQLTTTVSGVEFNCPNP